MLCVTQLSAVISLYSINWVAFMMGTQTVFREVGTVFVLDLRWLDVAETVLSNTDTTKVTILSSRLAKEFFLSTTVCPKRRNRS